MRKWEDKVAIPLRESEGKKEIKERKSSSDKVAKTMTESLVRQQ